jgi:hypothetical protein
MQITFCELALMQAFSKTLSDNFSTSLQSIMFEHESDATIQFLVFQWSDAALDG